MTYQEQIAQLALAAYRATTNRDAAVALLKNNAPEISTAEAQAAWYAIDAVHDDILCVQWHSETKDMPCE